jgi:hypothetical protein
MALPWVRIIDGLLGATDMVRWVRGKSDVPAPSSGGGLEHRLAGVVVSALKETFDRDRARLELEQQRADEERLRAERAFRLELLRQAGDREISRQRLLGALAIGSVLAIMIMALLLQAGTTTRILLVAGALLQIGAFGCASAAQSQVARALGQGDDRALAAEITESAAGRSTVWLLVLGLALVVNGVFAA